MAALDTIACRSGARIVSSCFGVGGSILLASEPDDELTTRQKHRGVAIRSILARQKIRNISATA